MKNKRKPNGYWTKEKCHIEALKCETKNEFVKKYNDACSASRKIGCYNEITSHMIRPIHNIKWTKEKCHIEALKFNRRVDFSKKMGKAYTPACKNGWLDEICSHMPEIRKPDGYWTKEICREVALKYDLKSELVKNDRVVFDNMYINGWIEELCSHMTVIQKLPGFWNNYNNCKEEALKYNNLTDFNKNSGGASSAARRNGWFDEFTSHMIEIKHPKGYWTKERCHIEALKYQTRTEFYKKGIDAHSAAKRNGWFEDICTHMEIPLSGIYIIYGYFFTDKRCYIGLTKNRKQRHFDHFKKDSPVYEHIQKSGLTPKYRILFEQEIYSDKQIKKQEKIWLEKSILKGWIPLNKATTGAIGSRIRKWTKEKCQEEALNYKSKKEFSQMNPGSHSAAYKNGWLNEICSHMIGNRKPNGYWTYKQCKIESLNYSSRSIFQKKSSTACGISRKNNWLDEFFPKNKN